MSREPQVIRKIAHYERNEAWMNHLNNLRNICKLFQRNNTTIMRNFTVRGNASNYPNLCIDFDKEVQCDDLKKIRKIFKELGYTLAPHDRGETCTFLTFDISTVSNPTWFNNIVGIAVNEPTREEVKEIFDLLETNTKIYYLSKNSKNSKYIDTVSCPFPTSELLEMFYEEVKTKFPDASIEKTNKGGVHVGLKYITKDAQGKIKTMRSKVMIENNPIIQNTETKPVQKVSESVGNQPEIEIKVVDKPDYNINQFDEIIEKNLRGDLSKLLKEYGLIPEKVDMTDLVKLPNNQEVITLPMEVLSKLDNVGIHINVQLLRKFLSKNFPTT